MTHRALHAIALLVAVVSSAHAWGHPVGSARPSQDKPTPEAVTAAPEAIRVEPSPLVERVIGDELTTPAQRQRMRLFHGKWDEVDAEELPVALRAEWALLRGELDAAVWADEDTPPLLEAEAAWRRQRDLPRVLTLLDRAADEADGVEARVRLMRGRTHLLRGRYDAALEAVLPLRELLETTTLDSAAELTAAAQGVALLARLEGTPSRDHHLAMSLLARARELDPLHWPAMVAEADLLLSKGNREDAHAALMQAASLNPRSAEAWYGLGRMAVESFNFDAAAAAQAKLDAINPDHRLARDLRLITLIQQRDTDGARSLVDELEADGRYATHRRMQALFAAVSGLAYRQDAMRDRLDAIDAMADGAAGAGAIPGSIPGAGALPGAGAAEPYFVVGEALSFARQYDVAEALLREAVDREPNWPEPRVALGLLLMQAGDLPAARETLTHAARLDPFHVRAANQLRLVEELLDHYVTLETDHFVIRCAPGIDEVLARDMAASLDAMHAEVAGDFAHRPGVKTQIDLLPDENRFAVRITGMPDIWTIAAATGDVIAMTPPRSGARQRGAFDWPVVLRHEYTHTVTLAATGNRIPHWFTEACAVWQEPNPRSDSRCRLLADALHTDRLFALDEINWGFIRPEKPADRALAYAQAEWMLEYLLETHGREAMIALLDRHAAGVPNVRAMEEVTGESAAGFMSSFRAWARGQVEAWGLRPSPAAEAIESLKRESNPAARNAALDELLQKHPDDPAVLRLAAERAVAGDDADAARALLERYAEAVPVDPWPHRELVRLSEANGEAASPAMVASLTFLDEREASHGRWAAALANLHHRSGDLGAASRFAERALHREPYNPSYRELAATVALQAGDLKRSLHHLEAMPLLEPGVELHQRRLEALRRKMGAGAGGEG